MVFKKGSKSWNEGTKEVMNLGMSGNTACDNLDNKIAGYSYTCQTCIDTAGTTQTCATTLLTLNANCGCRID